MSDSDEEGNPSVRQGSLSSLFAAVGGATSAIKQTTMKLMGFPPRDSNEPNLRDQINQRLRSRAGEYLDEDSINVRVCTWNVANQSPPSDAQSLNAWLVDDGDVADVVVVGLQEVEFGGAALMLEVTDASVSWMEAVIDCLNSAHRGVRYKKIDTAQLVGLVLVLVVRSDFAEHVKHVKKSVTRTGAISGVMGNKGAIGIHASIKGKRFLFVSAHFHAHDGNIKLRNSNYHDALAQLKFDLPPEADDEVDVAGMFYSAAPTKSKTIGQSVFSRLFRMRPRKSRALTSEKNQLETHDYVFFFGDLNYRLDTSRREALGLIEEGRLDDLLLFDQLRGAMRRKEVFAGFEEMDITFIPTYKFDIGSTAYDTSRKQRTPGWTDRILFYSLAQSGNRGSNTPRASVGKEKVLRKTFSAPTLSTTTPPTSSDVGEGTQIQNVIAPLHYHSTLSTISDHHPVSASFDVQVVTQNSDQLNAVLFDIKEELGVQDECDDDAYL